MNNDRLIPRADKAGVSSYKLYSEGQAITTEYDLVSIDIDEGANKIGTAEIALIDGDPAAETFEISSGDEFDLGKKIKIELGYDAQEDIVFEGIVTHHSIQSFGHKPSVIKVTCKHDAFKMAIQRKNKYFYEETDSAIIESIIGEYGLTPNVDGTDFEHPELVQFYTTDWDFILSRAEVNGFLVFTEGDQVIVKRPELDGSAVLNLRYGGNILDFEGEIDARYQYKGIKSFAWDPGQQDLIEVDGQSPTSGLTSETDPDQLADVVGLENLELFHAGQLKTEELQSWSDGQFVKSRLATVRGMVSFEGYKQNDDGSGILKPGTLIELAGVGRRFEGLVYVSRVRQSMSMQGWRTVVEFGLSPENYHKIHKDVMETPANGLLPAISGLQIGLVTQLQDDPDGEERILVRIPMIEKDGQGVWARIATLDAGETRGTFFRPEIGDEVILGFLNDDPRNPIVLGMVHSSSKPSHGDFPAEDTNHKKGYVSREELKMTFDDEKKLIKLETPAGKYVTLDDDQGIVELADETGNVITMDSSGITIDTPGKLTLKAAQDISAEGLNISHKANAQFKAEGAAGAEVTTSAIAVLKGSLVQIN